MFVGDETTTDGEQAGDDIRRDSHELSDLIGVAHTLDNGGEEDGDGVERGVDADGDDHVNPDLPVTEGILHELPIKGIREDRAVLFETAENLLALVISEELGSVGVIVHDKEGHDSKDKGDEALNDEDPGPAVKVANTVHLHDTPGQETTESTSSSGSREEDGHTETALVTFIPHSDVVGDTGEKTTLGEAECHSSAEKTPEILDASHDAGHDGPDNHDERNPEGRTETLHGDVGWDLSRDIEGKEDGHGDLVGVALSDYDAYCTQY